MADEIDVGYHLSLNKSAGTGTLKFEKEVKRGRQLDDQSTAKKVSNTQTVGTTHEALALGDVTTPGWSVFTNLDATNFVEIGIDVTGTFHPFVKIKPGVEHPPVYLNTTAPYARADTADVELDYTILEQ
jgi:hypothetical protein